MSHRSLGHHLSDAYRAWLNAPTLDALTRLEARLMSALSDKIAEVKQHVDDAVTRVNTDRDALTAKVAELQALVDSGGATQADLDALTAIEAQLDALDPTPPPPPPAA